LDILPVQASSVPCEHIFSSAAETDTKKQNRLSPHLMEALQILKFIYKKERLNFTEMLKPMAEDTARTYKTDLADLLTQDASDERTAMDKLLRECASDEE